MHLIDRRLNSPDKSLENRQRFMRRQRGKLRAEVAKAVGKIPLKGDNPVTIEFDNADTHEPRFHRGTTGKHEHVLPGNKKYIEGDILARPPKGKNGKPTEGGEGSGEDSFQFTMSRDEYLDILFEDMELPDLAKKSIMDTEAAKVVRNGFSNTGNANNLDITRTMRKGMMRRIALGRPKEDDVEKAKAEIEEMELTGKPVNEIEEKKLALENMERRRKGIPYLDNMDQRFRNFTTQPTPNSQAVMFCLMDVSGSVSEHMKDLSKRFFLLLGIFLEKKYKRFDIVFIRHTDSAQEVDEETFFRERNTGGTKVSTALEKMQEIIKLRYPSSAWNIYGAQSSDGDNERGDGPTTIKLMQQILPLVQYFAYLEVAESNHSLITSTSLSQTYNSIKHPCLAIKRVTDKKQIFSVFHELFARTKPGAAPAASRPSTTSQLNAMTKDPTP